jgi:hypothetical protein
MLRPVLFSNHKPRLVEQVFLSRLASHLPLACCMKPLIFAGAQHGLWGRPGSVAATEQSQMPAFVPTFGTSKSCGVHNISHAI